MESFLFLIIEIIRITNSSSIYISDPKCYSNNNYTIAGFFESAAPLGVSALDICFDSYPKKFYVFHT